MALGASTSYQQSQELCLSGHTCLSRYWSSYLPCDLSSPKVNNQSLILCMSIPFFFFYKDGSDDFQALYMTEMKSQVSLGFLKAKKITSGIEDKLPHFIWIANLIIF